MTNESLFSGVKVLDIASFIAAPASTTVLSDFGADVVKVERSGMGDPHRYTYLSLPNPPGRELCMAARQPKQARPCAGFEAPTCRRGFGPAGQVG